MNSRPPLGDEFPWCNQSHCRLSPSANAIQMYFVTYCHKPQLNLMQKNISSCSPFLAVPSPVAWLPLPTFTGQRRSMHGHFVLWQASNKAIAAIIYRWDIKKKWMSMNALYAILSQPVLARPKSCTKYGRMCNNEQKVEKKNVRDIRMKRANYVMVLAWRFIKAGRQIWVGPLSRI